MIEPRSPTLQEDSLPAEPQGTVVKHERVTWGYRCNLMTVIATIHYRGLTFSNHQPWLFCPPLTLGCLLPFYINRWGNGGSESSELCPSLWLMLSLIPWVWIHDAEFKTWVLELQNPCSPSLGCTVSGSWKSEQGELELAREGLDMGTRRLCIWKYDGKRHLRPKDTFTKFYFFSLTLKKNECPRKLVRSLCYVDIGFLVLVSYSSYRAGHHPGKLSFSVLFCAWDFSVLFWQLLVTL